MAGNRQHAVDGNAEIDRPTPGATWHRTATALHERHEIETSVRQLDVDLLRPGRYQPRRRFTSEALAELAESIRTVGVVQPVIVRPIPDTAPTRYEIIAGERRWRSTLVQALVENIQREDLNPVEVARGVERLISEFRLTHQEAAHRLGRSRDSITHLLRILKLEPPVLAQVEDDQLSLGHAKLLAGLPQPMQRHLADEAIHKVLSVRALERRIRALNGTPERRSDAHSRRDADIVRLEQRVGEIVGADVSFPVKRTVHK